VEEIDDFGGKSLELVVEVVGEEVDPLVGSLDPGADFGEVRSLLMAELVELGPNLAQELFEFLFERRTSLEVVDDFEEDEESCG